MADVAVWVALVAVCLVAVGDTVRRAVDAATECAAVAGYRPHQVARGRCLVQVGPDMWRAYRVGGDR